MLVAALLVGPEVVSHAWGPANALVCSRSRAREVRERPLELDSRGVETVQLHSSTVPVHRSHHLANPSSVRREGKRKALMRAKAQGLPFPSHFKVCVPSRQPAMEVVYGTID